MLEKYECVNERIVWCRLKGKYMNVTAVQAYAPTEDKTGEEKEGFYENLRTVVQDVRQHDMLLLMQWFPTCGSRPKTGSRPQTWSRHQCHGLANRF